MEEDITLIEEKLKIIESLCTDDCINKSTVIDPLKYAIENLLTRYKQLEEENKKFNPEVWHNEGWDRADEYWKSKVKEMIEELENQRDKVKIFKNIDEYDRCVGKIEVLQDLLREE